MTTLHIDFETRSTVEIKTAGLDNYARHATTDTWCMAYAFGDEPVQIWQMGDEGLPSRIRTHVADGGTVVAHNAAFELAIWNHVMVPRYGWPALKPEQVRCTMAMCYAMALPGALDNAAAAVGLQHRKDAAGYRLMIQMSKPRSIEPNACATCGSTGIVTGRVCHQCGGRKTITWWDDAEKLQKLYAYCKQDVVVERELEKRIMPLSQSEQALWVLDQRINNRGIYVDRETAQKAIAVVTAEQDRLNTDMRRVTGNFVGFCTEHPRITKWVRSRGVVTDGVAKSNIIDLLEQPNLPADVRAALLLRQEAGKSSTAKLQAMVEAASSDERLRGMFQYHGASTGRWAGRRVQLQNIPRWTKGFGVAEAEDVIAALAKRPTAQAAQYIRMLHDSPMTIMSLILRPLLRAAPGHDLLAADFNAIEARGVAWLAGQQDVLDVFATGADIYCHEATPIYGRTITKEDDGERQVGKVSVLALGYGGGIGAFASMAKNYTVDLEPVYHALLPTFTAEELEQAENNYATSKRNGGTLSRDAGVVADIIKQRWRRKNTKIKDYWEHLETAALDAVRYPTKQTFAGPSGRAVKYRMAGSFLWCLLPSGRCLCYPYAKLKPKMTPWGEEKEQIHYMTVDSTSNKWVEADTYGGSLAENVTQAVCRDLLSHAMTNCEAAGYPVVLHVHDEVVAEVPKNKGDLKEFESLCAKTEKWAAGLPVVAKGWRGARYRK